jgi:hypothetical protein
MADKVVWTPQPGSQVAFLTCPIFEVLYEGTRGPGKTDGLLMDFAQHVGQGWGAEWRGIIFRETFPQLDDIINKSEKWFNQIYPGRAKYNQANHTWTWSSGEALLFRHMQKPKDYWKYHGHAFPFIGWEELTNWHDDKCYRVMMSCCRSTVPGMPRKYRATTNPYGPGHNWVKKRFRLPQSRFRVIEDSRDMDGEIEPPRVAIHGHLQENRLLLDADPQYIPRLRAAARNPMELKAWMQGTWDITSGGMFDDLWQSDTHIVPWFPASMIPKSWRIDRAFDWGSSKPFSLGWWLQSSGEPIVVNGRRIGAVRGDLIRWQEWYGWCNVENEGLKMLAKDVAIGIRDREDDLGIAGRVQPGPADASIFDEENGNNIAKDMAAQGIRFLAADKSPGSRKQGWEQVRKYLGGALLPPSGGPREHPGLFTTDQCHQFLRTFPSLPRDDKDLDDVNTDAEDHNADETRYRVRNKTRTVTQQGFR